MITRTAFPKYNILYEVYRTRLSHGEKSSDVEESHLCSTSLWGTIFHRAHLVALYFRKKNNNNNKLNVAIAFQEPSLLQSKTSLE